MYLNRTIAATVIADRQRQAGAVRRAREGDARNRRRLQSPRRAAAIWIAILAHR